MLLFISACGPYLPKSIEVPTISSTGKIQPLSTIYIGDKLVSTPSVEVGKFNDQRSQNYGILSGSDEVDFNGDISNQISTAFADALSEKGFDVINTSNGKKIAPKVYGVINKWFTEVESNLKGQLKSQAEIEVYILNSKGSKVYTGNFKGSVKSESPIISNQDVIDSLSDSMGEAIDKAVNDKKLLENIINN